LPSEAVERDVFEETGFIVQANRLIGVYDANHIGPLQLFHAYKLEFLREIKSGSARPSNETSEISSFGKGVIPDVLSGERSKPRHIQDAFKNQDTRVIFD
jgi:ADP-ribose pyrophosphatase YjhB (NUDIX family)